MMLRHDGCISSGPGHDVAGRKLTVREVLGSQGAVAHLLGLIEPAAIARPLIESRASLGAVTACLAMSAVPIFVAA